MKRAGLIVLGLLSLLNVGVAQLATDPNEGLWIKKDAPRILYDEMVRPHGTHLLRSTVS